MSWLAPTALAMERAPLTLPSPLLGGGGEDGVRFHRISIHALNPRTGRPKSVAALVVARASRPCVPVRTGETPVPLRRFGVRGVARAFTLLELLVVMAILGVLAALVLPAVARAKHKSLSTVCISNSRQIIQAIQLYASDHDHAYPLALYKPTGSAGPVFGFDDYIYGHLGTPLSTAEQESHAIPLAKRLRLLTCPADKAPPLRSGPDIWRRTYSMAEANMASSRTGSPLRNIQDGGIGVYYSTFWGPFPSSNPAEHVPVTENVVIDPLQTLVVVERPHPDNYGGNDHFAVTRSTRDQLRCFRSPKGAMEYHGRGRFVYAYCDGRVVLQEREKTWGRATGDNAWAGDWTLRTDD